MAQLTERLSDEDRQRMTDEYRPDEALRAALAASVNAMLALDTTQGWGAGSTSSSEGPRLLVPPRVLRRTASHRMGDCALEVSTFLADTYAPCYSVPMEWTERAAPYVLDGWLAHEADRDPQEHDPATHGSIALHFAAFPLLGQRFCPRIRGWHPQWMYRIAPQKAYGPLPPLVRQPKHTRHLDWITAHWDRLGQGFASLAAGQTTAAVARKRRLACGPRKHLSRAVRELGRVGKTIGILASLTDPARRRRVRRGRLKGEQLHA